MMVRSPRDTRTPPGTCSAAWRRWFCSAGWRSRSARSGSRSPHRHRHPFPVPRRGRRRVGLTLAEAGIFMLGAALIARFLLRAALPRARTRFVSAGIRVRWYRNRRKRSILSQLPPLLDLLSGHVRAGHSLSESLAETVPLLPAGIREEMAWIMQKNRLGPPLTEALAHW